MNRKQFNSLMHNTFREIEGLSGTKGEEYAGAQDVLADFKQVAQECGVTPEQALLTYATKHWRAIAYYARAGETLSEPIKGRIHDLILYLILLEAMSAAADGPDAACITLEISATGIAVVPPTDVPMRLTDKGLRKTPGSYT